MYPRVIRRTGRRGRQRPCQWLRAVIVTGAVLATLAAFTVNPLKAGAGTQVASTKTESAPVVGVQDSWVAASCESGSYKAHTGSGVPAVDSPYWAGLRAGTVRFSPTWDIALPAKALTGRDRSAVMMERTCFNYWLGRLAVRGVSAEIAFKPDYCYKNKAGCPDTQTGNVVIPTLSEYRTAIKDFVKAYPQIQMIAPWGEPDFQPRKPEPLFRIGGTHGANFGGAHCAPNAAVDVCGPKLAAAMWITVHNDCPTCKVIAGDFGGYGPQDYAYLKPYDTYLKVRGYRPPIWGIHPYSDVKDHECAVARTLPCGPEALGSCRAGTLVACFAGWLKADGYTRHTRIWLDELSSFYKPGKGWNRTVQAAGATYLLSALPGVTGKNEPVVTRIYYMRFAGPNNDALIYRGRPQPAYASVANRS